jgi:hypothetical protein
MHEMRYNGRFEKGFQGLLPGDVSGIADKSESHDENCPKSTSSSNSTTNPNVRSACQVFWALNQQHSTWDDLMIHENWGKEKQHQ